MKKLAYLLPLFIAVVMVGAPMSVSAASHQAPTSGLGTIDATGATPGASTGTGTISSTTELVGLILGLVNWFAWFVALAAVLFGLYAGVLFITAGGDDEKITKAKNILLYAIVGIVVAILAFSIVNISRSIAGLT